MEMHRGKVQPERKMRNNNELKWIFLLCLFGLAINLFINGIVNLFGLPLYLDTIGTIFTACVGGALPGIFVAFFTNLFLGFGNPESIYFGVLNVLIAVVSAFWLQDRKRRRNLLSLMLLVIVLTGIGGGIGALQTWVFDGYSTEGANGSLILFFYEKCHFSEFWAQFTAAVTYDLIDKGLAVAISMSLILLMPDQVREKLRFTGWLQTPLDEASMDGIKGMKKQSVSLGTKIVLIFMTTFVITAVVVAAISLVLFRKYSMAQRSQMTTDVAKMVASVIRADRVDEYIEKGEEAEDYLSTKRLLTKIRSTYADVKYLYVYKILDDGCQVVFDLDADDVPGEKPGTIVDFDVSFEPYLASLKLGKRLDPIVSDDTYGWLLTVYEPVYDSNGKCVCYAAADVSLDDVRRYEVEFITKLSSLFLGFFGLLLAVGLWVANYQIVYPINAMAYAANSFSYDSEDARGNNVKLIQKLGIHTKDELENLYDALEETTEDNVKTFNEMQHKTELLATLQSGLIMVLADMVENRDQSTGDHVRKTAAYVKIILEKMREMGYHSDELTDEYISDVVKSAPLHDIGKIQVSDTILNKPGKLTDEEFEKMKKHTLAGQKIIEQTIATIPEASYLKEAMNLAAYHHEKWNGKGYPYGLAGEDIPLSARVMAVADVFDALVSKRCYKEPFSFEKAMNIIREDAGTHFDPQVAEAFLASEEEVRQVAERFENVADGEGKEIINMFT